MSDASGYHIVVTYSSMGLVMALYAGFTQVREKSQRKIISQVQGKVSEF